MSPVKRTLLLIAAFVALSLGSFIWYIATWDPAEREPVSTLPAPYLLAQNIPGSLNFERNSRLGAEPPFLSQNTQRSA